MLLIVLISIKIQTISHQNVIIILFVLSQFIIKLAHGETLQWLSLFKKDFFVAFEGRTTLLLSMVSVILLAA